MPKVLLDGAVLKLVEKMYHDEASLLTLYYGNEITEESANAMAEAIENAYSDLDIEVYQGGQPLYYYLISLE